MSDFHQKLYKIVTKGSHGSKVNLYFDYGIMWLIILNVIAIIIETISGINKTFLDVSDK